MSELEESLDGYFPIPPTSHAVYKLIPEKEYNDLQAYISRLEAAYLDVVGPKSFDPDGCNCKICQRQRKKAHENLERIRNGSNS